MVTGVEMMESITRFRCAGCRKKVCECGCGRPAPIAKVSNARYGAVAGQPLPYLPNHKRRVERELRPRICNPQAGSARIWVITAKGRRYLADRKVALGQSVSS